MSNKNKRNRVMNCVGKEVLVHYNLSNGTWSCKLGDRVVLWADSLVLKVTDIKISESGRQRAIEKGQRNVHAFVKGIVLEQNTGREITQKNRVISYNPYKKGYFYYRGRGLPKFKAQGQVIYCGKETPYFYELES